MSVRWVLLISSGDPEAMHRAASCAAAAAVGGDRVDAVFYDRALEKLVSGRLDDLDGPPANDVERARRQRLDAAERTPSAELWRAARASGRLRWFACSASVAVLPGGLDDVTAEVDEIVGWPTVLGLMRESTQVLHF